MGFSYNKQRNEQWCLAGDLRGGGDVHQATHHRRRRVVFDVGQSRQRFCQSIVERLSRARRRDRPVQQVRGADGTAVEIVVH